MKKGNKLLSEEYIEVFFKVSDENDPSKKDLNKAKKYLLTNSPAIFNSLFLAIKENAIEKIQETIKQNPKLDFSIPDKFGRTDLMFAALCGYSEIVNLLLQRGADINVKDYKGETALINAVGNGHLEIVELLLENNADIYTSDKRGKTALMLAAQGDMKRLSN